jgi:hypothetical protein
MSSATQSAAKAKARRLPILSRKLPIWLGCSLTLFSQLIISEKTENTLSVENTVWAEIHKLDLTGSLVRQLELHGNLCLNLDRFTVEQIRFVLPLLHRLNRGVCQLCISLENLHR